MSVVRRFFKDARNNMAGLLLSEDENVFFNAANQIAEVLNLTVQKKYCDIGALNTKITSRMEDTRAYSPGVRACCKKFMEVFLKQKAFDAVEVGYSVRHLISDGTATQQEVIKALATTIGCVNNVFIQGKSESNEILSSNEQVIMRSLEAIKEYVKDLDKNPDMDSLSKPKTAGGGFDHAKQEFRGLSDACEQLKEALNPNDNDNRNIKRAY